MKVDRDASLVMDALMMVVWRRGQADAWRAPLEPGVAVYQRAVPASAARPRHHLLDEQGRQRPGQLRDGECSPLTRTRGVRGSLSSLKTERTARKVYRTRDEARADVFEYSERFQNPTRRRSKLGYLSPMAFEERAMRTLPRVHETGSRPSSDSAVALLAMSRQLQPI